MPCSTLNNLSMSTASEIWQSKSAKQAKLTNFFSSLWDFDSGITLNKIQYFITLKLNSLLCFNRVNNYYCLSILFKWHQSQTYKWHQSQTCLNDHLSFTTTFTQHLGVVVKLRFYCRWLCKYCMPIIFQRNWQAPIKVTYSKQSKDTVSGCLTLQL